MLEQYMKLMDFVCLDAIVPDLEANDRDGAIYELAGSLAKIGALGKIKPDEVAKAVIERENEASTGMGKGVAVPHVKHAKAKRVMAAIGQSSRGIDFAALDKKPVYSIILLISPGNDPEQHLQAMENIFRHLQQEQFRKFLRQAQTKEQIIDLVEEADENPSL